MPDSFILLIADRNRNVREFLRREFTLEGYRVEVAKDGDEVLTSIESSEPPDVLVLDLEIQFRDGFPFFEKLEALPYPIPVVIHSFLPEDGAVLGRCDAFVEKSENIDKLKSALKEVLHKFYPERTPQEE